MQHWIGLERVGLKYGWAWWSKEKREELEAAAAMSENFIVFRALTKPRHVAVAERCGVTLRTSKDSEHSIVTFPRDHIRRTKDKAKGSDWPELQGEPTESIASTVSIALGSTVARGVGTYDLN